MDVRRLMRARDTSSILLCMIGPDTLNEVEGDALALLRMARIDPEELASPQRVADALGVLIVEDFANPLSRKRESDIAREGATWKIRLYHRMPPARERWIIGHELGHWFYRTHNMQLAIHDEARCDAFGACIVAPRPAFAAAARTLGHRVHELANQFSTTQALALLRIGEVTDRPVLLFRPRPITRGAAFDWGRDPRSLPRRVAHLVRVDAGWGMMAA